MKYVIEGNPIAWKRPGKNGNKSYNTQRDIMKQIAWMLLCQRVKHDADILNSPLRFDVTFYMPIPMSLSKNKQYALSGQPCAKKPDLSNLLKLIEDSANGVLYEDDALICKSTIAKVYDFNPRTEIEISVYK